MVLNQYFSDFIRGKYLRAMQVNGFNHITLSVKKLETTIEFYTNTMGMTLRHQGKTDAYLEWGDAWICIVERPDIKDASITSAGMNHIAFYIEEKHFDEAVEILRKENVKIVRGPLKRGTGWTVNFLDPNGIEFELHTGTLDGRMKIWK